VTKWPTNIPDTHFFEKLVSCREGCPVNTDARGYVQAVAKGDYKTAYRIARGPNPFASICGLDCGAPCEKACRRGDIDEPVSIRALKRTTTVRHGVETNDDLHETLTWSTSPGSLDPPKRPEAVAVVGAGVAGMSCAHDLARLGYKVVVFEADPAPGGMLRFGVPVYRLPANVWKKEIEAIEMLGVEIKYNTKIGDDLTVPQLREQGFDAIFIGAGLQKGRMLDLPGKELPGIYSGLEIIRSFNDHKDWPDLGRVVVVGGGNVAYDAARSAVRLPGCDSVDLVCLESKEEMPADDIEIIEGDEEKITRHNRRGPVRFTKRDGKLSGLEVQKVTRVFDEEGRFAPEMEPGSEMIIECDTIFLSIGQVGDTGFVNGVPDLELGRGGSVVAERETGATSIPWLFAGGDVAMGPGLFIDAIAQSRRAALAIHAYLAGEDQAAADAAKPQERVFVEETIRQDMRHDYTRLRGVLPPAIDVKDRFKSRDTIVEEVFSDEAARLQGARCLRCEVETIFDGRLCILCGGCSDVCPTWCLRLVNLEEVDNERLAGMEGSAIIKDEDRCIRCGMCAYRCPTKAITMERVCGFEPWTMIGLPGHPDQEGDQ